MTAISDPPRTREQHGVSDAEVDQLLAGVPFPAIYEAKAETRRSRNRTHIVRQRRRRRARRPAWPVVQLIIGVTVGSACVAVIGAGVTGHDPSYGLFQRFDVYGTLSEYTSAAPADDGLKVTSATDKVKRPDGKAYRELGVNGLKPGESTTADLRIQNTGDQTIKVSIDAKGLGDADQLSGLTGRIIAAPGTAREVALYTGVLTSMKADDIELKPHASRMIGVEVTLNPTADPDAKRDSVQVPMLVQSSDAGFRISDYLDR